jgi:hypothetical protein
MANFELKFLDANNKMFVEVKKTERLHTQKMLLISLGF